MFKTPDRDTGSIFVVACILFCVWGVVFIQALPIQRELTAPELFSAVSLPASSVIYPLVTYVPVPLERPSPSPLSIAIPSIQARSALLFDISANSSVFAYQASAVSAVGSVTKLMTALVVSEHYGVDDQGMITISAEDMAVEYPSKIIAPGDQLRVSEAIRILLLGSDNSVALALARAVASSTQNFVGQMNIRAYSLGMVNSSFADPVGFLGNVSSPLDLAVLMRYLVNHRPDLLQISSYPYLTLILDSGKVITVVNTNILADKIPGFIGGKTGFLEEAGGSLVTVFRLRDQTLATVVLGSPDRFGDTAQLIQWYLKQPE